MHRGADNQFLIFFGQGHAQKTLSQFIFQRSNMADIDGAFRKKLYSYLDNFDWCGLPPNSIWRQSRECPKDAFLPFIRARYDNSTATFLTLK